MARILCLGDSITDCGRLFSSYPLGDGYVRMLSEAFPGHQFINKGVDGFTVKQLLYRAAREYLPEKADLYTVLIGVNDLCSITGQARFYDNEEQLLRAFAGNYRSLLRQLKKTGAPVIVMEPFLFPYPPEYTLWFPVREKMSRSIASLSEAFSCIFLPLQEPLTDAFAHSQEPVTTDGIHLTGAGHRILFSLLKKEIAGIFRPDHEEM